MQHLKKRTRVLKPVVGDSTTIKKDFHLSEGELIISLDKLQNKKTVTEEMIKDFVEIFNTPDGLKEKKVGKSYSIEETIAKRIDKLALTMDKNSSEVISIVMSIFFESNMPVIKELINRESHF